LASAPSGVDEIKYVTGANRILFSAAAFAMCWVAANWNQRHNVILTTCMHFLGITSYSLYLLHPIVFGICNSINFKTCHLPFVVMAFCVALPASLLASRCSYTFIEKPAMNWAKRLCGKV